MRASSARDRRLDSDPVTSAAQPNGGTPGRLASLVGRPAAALLLAAVLVACAIVGFASAFCTFNFWDDEGYFLLALRAYREHGGLYEEIRTVFYGPLYFQVVTALFGALGHPVDSAGARWLMLAGWLAATLATAFVAWRLNRSLLAAAIAVAVGFPFLSFFTNEPLHATSLNLLFLAALLVLVAGKLGGDGRPTTRVLAACGALCAAVVLVKANVGVFLSLAFVAAFVPRMAVRGAAVARGALALALVALPFALMRPLLSIDWVGDYALLVSISVLPFAIGLLRRRGDEPEAWGRSECVAFLAGGAALTAVSLGWIFVRGTTIAGLWRSLVTDAAEFPLINHYSPALPPREQVLLGTLPVLVALFLRPRSSALAALQLLASLFLLGEGLLMRAPFYSLPFVWLACGAGHGSRPRTFLGLLAVLFALQAYPIAGCQLGLFSLVSVLVAVTGIWDAARALPWRERAAPILRVLAPSAFACAVLALLWNESPVWREFTSYRTRWSQNTPLDLPGTGAMRLPEVEAARYGWLAANLRHNADTFLGVPGVPSLYFWSGLESPVPFYPHHWVLFRRADEEEALAKTLSTSKRMCVVKNLNLLGFWIHDDLPDGPVKRALAEDFEVAGGVGDYALLFPKRASPDLVLTASPLQGREALLERHKASRVFLLSLPEMKDARVTRLVLHDTASGVDLLDTAALRDERRLVVTTPMGEELLRGPTPAPLDTQRPSKYLMLWPPLALEHGAVVLIVRAYGAGGRVLARILFQAAREG